MNLNWRLWQTMIEFADSSLAEDLSNMDLVFASLPLEAFGILMLEVPSRYPRLQRLFPAMPSEEVQAYWTGSSGIELLHQGMEFVRCSLKYFPAEQVRARNLKALDFGCGWGRLLRLFSKYFPPENLEGVDPWQKSLDVCIEHGIKNSLGLSQYLPDSLPTQSETFDFIYAYSVFTHLSPKAMVRCLAALRKAISPQGTLLITIRPAEYWKLTQRPDAFETHLKEGFCFAPMEYIVDGESIYGDTSMDLDYLKRFSDWQVVDVEVSKADPLQVFVALRPL